MGQLVPELLPCLENSLRQVLGIGMAAVKSYVVDPSVKVQVREGLLEGVQYGLEVCLGKQGCLWASGCNPSGDMEPWAQFTFGQDSFVSRVDLHGKLQGQGRIVEVLCRLLQFLKVKGVVERAHVQ